jgi:hypothetical protein
VAPNRGPMSPWVYTVHNTGVGMTIALATIGGIVVILGAATKIPPAICALIRACIPLVTAIHDLGYAIRHRSNEANDAHENQPAP